MRSVVTPTDRIRTRGKPRSVPARSGFTLIELLVVIGIILLLTGLSLAVYTATVGGDRIRMTARTGQAVFLGARDRAAQAKALRGVRLIPDTANNNLVTAFQYVQPISNETVALHGIQLERPDADGDPTATPNDATNPNITIVRGFNVDWVSLNSRGLLSYPARIRIPSTTGTWYSFTNVAAGVMVAGQPTTTLQLTTPFQDISGAAASPAQVAYPSTNGTFTSCDLELANQFLENSQPVALPSSSVIQLNRSGNIPSDWTSSRTTMDIMFSPRGSVTGPIAAGGPIYLYVCDRQDADKDLDPVVAKGEKVILAIFPQTGNVSTYPVDTTDANADNIADDPFLRAKRGAVAGK